MLLCVENLLSLQAVKYKKKKLLIIGYGIITRKVK